MALIESTELSTQRDEDRRLIEAMSLAPLEAYLTSLSDAAERELATNRRIINALEDSEELESVLASMYEEAIPRFGFTIAEHVAAQAEDSDDELFLAFTIAGLLNQGHGAAFATEWLVNAPGSLITPQIALSARQEQLVRFGEAVARDKDRIVRERPQPQARRIGESTERQIERLIAMHLNRASRAGVQLSDEQLAQLVGDSMRGNVPARAVRIAIFETLNASEEMTNAERMRVIEDISQPIALQGFETEQAFKDWLTQDDDRVRTQPGTGHVGANRQRRPLHTPFTVGGQRLRWPGDVALGATQDNVQRCRCQSQARFPDGRLSIRRRIGA